MQSFLYRPSFSKHLWNLAASGFFARELDADDHAFLETVRERGIANGSLPRVDSVLIEELEFWHLPYTIAPGIERRAGPVQREQRQLRTSAWHARRAIREHEKAIAAAELQREQIEWEKANAERKRRAVISDKEWEAARPLKFGTVAGRHFVPQWKLDERGELSDWDRAIEARKQRKREQEREKREERKERLERESQKYQEEQQKREMLAAQERMREAQREQERIIAEARRTARLEWKHTPPPIELTLKAKIRGLIDGSGRRWSIDDLMHATGCANAELMASCLYEMVRDGQLNTRQGY